MEPYVLQEPNVPLFSWLNISGEQTTCFTVPEVTQTSFTYYLPAFACAILFSCIYSQQRHKDAEEQNGSSCIHFLLS